MKASRERSMKDNHGGSMNDNHEGNLKDNRVESCETISSAAFGNREEYRPYIYIYTVDSGDNRLPYPTIPAALCLLLKCVERSTR